MAYNPTDDALSAWESWAYKMIANDALGEPATFMLQLIDEVRSLRSSLICCYCDGPAEGHYSIHRDGFGIGPEVPLCDACGSTPEPTCEEIWDRIGEEGKR